MRRRFLAALIVVLTGHGLAFAQHCDAFAAPIPRPAKDALSDVFNRRGPCDDEDVPAKPSGLRGSGEYLVWWFENGRVPPLVTAGGDALPGSSGTQVLLDNLDFDSDFRQGGRFALSYHRETVRSIGVEAIFFFLSGRQSEVSFSSSGAPVLGRPFVNVATGMPDATLVASPGIAAGSVPVAARASLWGAEVNLAASLTCSHRFRLTALGGFRFIRLEDDLAIGEHFEVAPRCARLRWQRGRPPG